MYQNMNWGIMILSISAVNLLFFYIVFMLINYHKSILHDGHNLEILAAGLLEYLNFQVMSYFWNGYVLHDFLFKGLDAESIPGLIGICIGIFSVALLYEGLRSLKSILIQKYSETATGAKQSDSPGGINGVGCAATNRREDGEVLTDTANLESLVQNDNANNEHRRVKNGIIGKIIHLSMASSFHAVYVFLGFSLMNAVMTFNIYIFVSAILGIGLGYFFFYDCSRLKFPYGVNKSDVAQCQSLLHPEELQEDNSSSLENGGPNRLGTSNTHAHVNPVSSNENELVVQAEIYNAPLPTLL